MYLEENVKCEEIWSCSHRNIYVNWVVEYTNCIKSVTELLKRRLFAGKSDELYFWRDSNGIEIDVIEEDNLEIKAYEIKASETMNTAFFSNIKKIKEIAGLKAENTAIIYSGKSLPATSENGANICWEEI